MRTPHSILFPWVLVDFFFLFRTSDAPRGKSSCEGKHVGSRCLICRLFGNGSRYCVAWFVALRGRANARLEKALARPKTFSRDVPNRAYREENVHEQSAHETRPRKSKVASDTFRIGRISLFASNSCRGHRPVKRTNKRSRSVFKWAAFAIFICSLRRL